MNLQELKAIWDRSIEPISAPPAPVQPDWSVVHSVLRASGALDKVIELPSRPAPQSLPTPRPRRRPNRRRPPPKRRGSGWRPRSAAAMARRRKKRAAMLRARHPRRP